MPSGIRCTCRQCGQEFESSIFIELCPQCRDDFFICQSCDDVLPLDCYNEDGLCDGCYEASRSSGPIHEYHDGCPNGTIFYPNDRQSLYFGIELETDGYRDYESAARGVLKLSDGEKLFWLEEDSSLDEGFELITQPCTLEFHKTQFPWAEICDVLKQHGGHAEDSGSAALHVHLSKKFFPPGKQRVAALHMIYVFEKFRDEMLQTGNTSKYLANRSAHKHQPDWSNIEEYLDAHDVVGKYNSYAEDRMTSVNVDGGHGTIEIRIFRSTLDPDRIIGSIELVDHVARLVHDLTVSQLKRLSWKHLVDLARSNGYAQLGDIICPRKIVKPKPQFVPLYGEPHLGHTYRVGQVPSLQPRHIYGASLQGYRDRPDLPIEEGSRVRICIPEDQETSRGRVGVTNDIVGTVVSTNEFNVYIHWDSNFPGHWAGTREELVVVEEVHDEPEQATNQPEPSRDNGQRDRWPFANWFFDSWTAE